MARTDLRSSQGRRLTIAFAVAIGTVGALSIAVVPMRAITRADAKKVDGAKKNDPYASFVEPTRFKNGENWSGVGKAIYDQGAYSPFAQGTGTLISPCHVLTAGHVFFPSNDPRGGIGNKPNPNFAKTSQIETEASKVDQRKRPRFPWISLGGNQSFQRFALTPWAENSLVRLLFPPPAPAPLARLSRR